VRVLRDDKVRQAVSLWKALPTATWRAERERAGNDDPSPEEEPKFSFEAIDYLQRQIAVQRRRGTSTSSTTASSR
jgi:LPS sulfotransferase NodH